jgi:hypothetical protein
VFRRAPCEYSAHTTTDHRSMKTPRWIRRASVPALVRRLSRRHPELERQVLWEDATRICEREGIIIRLVVAPFGARLARFGQFVAIQINRSLDEKARTVAAMHELAHFWRDDPGEPAYYLDLGDRRQDPREEFADIFAWYVTTPHRPDLREGP